MGGITVRGVSNWSVGSIVTIVVTVVFDGAGWQMVSNGSMVGNGGIVSWGGSVVSWGGSVVTIMVTVVFNGAGWQMVSNGSVMGNGGIVSWGSNMCGVDGWCSVDGMVDGMHWGNMVGNDGWGNVVGMSMDSWAGLGDDCVETAMVISSVVNGAH